MQGESFYQVVNRLRQEGIFCPKVHLLGSYGLLRYPELAGDYARIGIALYGVLSTDEDTKRCSADLRPVLSLKARVASVKELDAGESAGYNRAFLAKRKTKTATLAIGYADGLPRTLSCGVGSVLINGRRAPIIGRICMDQLAVDITEAEDIVVGDVATFIEAKAESELAAPVVADQTGSISNELLCRIGARLPVIEK